MSDLSFWKINNSKARKYWRGMPIFRWLWWFLVVTIANCRSFKLHILFVALKLIIISYNMINYLLLPKIANSYKFKPLYSHKKQESNIFISFCICNKKIWEFFQIWTNKLSNRNKSIYPHLKVYLFVIERQFDLRKQYLI